MSLINKTTILIITYNRSELLLKCLESCIKQSTQSDHILIYDNGSNSNHSNTILKFIGNQKVISFNEDFKKTFYFRENNITYYRKKENNGPAPAFRNGLKLSLKFNSKFIWVMDDDALPANNALQKLLVNNSYDLSNCLVLNEKNKDELCFSLYDKENEVAINLKSESIYYSKNNIINGWAHTFNGSLLRSSAIKKIGLPLKELNGWGLEVEYLYRLINSGFKVATIVNSEIYHPKSRLKYIYVFKNIRYLDLPVKKFQIYYTSFFYILLKYNLKKFIKVFVLTNFALLLKLEFHKFFIFHFSLILSIKLFIKINLIK